VVLAFHRRRADCVHCLAGRHLVLRTGCLARHLARHLLALRIERLAGRHLVPLIERLTGRGAVGLVRYLVGHDPARLLYPTGGAPIPLHRCLVGRVGLRAQCRSGVGLVPLHRCLARGVRLWGGRRGYDAIPLVGCLACRSPVMWT
jgi:hypothetical protein